VEEPNTKEAFAAIVPDPTDQFDPNLGTDLEHGAECQPKMEESTAAESVERGPTSPAGNDKELQYESHEDERADVILQAPRDQSLSLHIPGSPFHGAVPGSPQSYGRRPRGNSERSEGERSDLSFTYSASHASSSRSQSFATTAPKTSSESACQTHIVWKDKGWRCMNCSKPPSGKGDLKCELKGDRYPVQRDVKRRALWLLEQLQGNWLLAGSCTRDVTAAEWLTAFSVDGCEVTSQNGTKQTLELATDLKVMLCGGEVKLDNQGNLHRHGRSGQHLVFVQSCHEEDAAAATLKSRGSMSSLELPPSVGK